LEDTGLLINKSLDSWHGIIEYEKVGKVAFNGAAASDDLNKLKADVDNWDQSQFNREMQPKCEELAKIIDNEIYTLRCILAAVKNLDAKINNILSDGDIQELNAFAKANGKKFAFDRLHDSLGQCRNILDELEPSSIDAGQSVFQAESYANFDIAKWLEQCNNAQKQLKTHIAQLQNIQKNLSDEAAQQLTGQVAFDTLYFSDLKNTAITELKQRYIEVGDKIRAVEKDAGLMEMRIFLEEIGDDAIPKLQTLKQTHSDIGLYIAKLESFTVDNLSAVKDFNGSRKKGLAGLALCDENLAKLNKSNIESTCKTGIENISSDISRLIKHPDRIKLLWTFYAKNKNWEQWQKFFDVFHIKIPADGSIQSSLPQLELMNNSEGFLQEADIISNPQQFFCIDTDEPVNFGWPKYARAKDDASVQFVFIPAKTGNSQPFYMAARETTNAQYCIFLNKIGAKNASTLEGWSMFTDQNKKQLIACAITDYPPCAIKHNKSGNHFTVSQADRNKPVTWVTFYGADSYARWLGGQLPSASQYKYACLANADTAYPWGNDIDQIQLYAHVRAVPWLQAAKEYNDKINNPLEMANPPVGAVKDFKENKTLDITEVLHKNAIYNSAWPLATNSKPNAWGLYDMLGNVWEWCIDDRDNTQVICGGSCLAPPKYITPDAMYIFKGKDSDVGFRIIIPAK
jgi:formylglycine-generating enzyme required for sulfatase activity